MRQDTWFSLEDDHESRRGNEPALGNLWGYLQELNKK